MASPPCLKRKQQPRQSYGQGGVVFGLAPLEPAPRDGRKRRNEKHTRIKHTLTPYFDGHLWRKYGEKVIKDAPYPRLYFRCSYREDRHCQASKLVQQVTHDDPPLFEVTYMHEHTCNAAPVPNPGVEAEDEPPACHGGLVLSFGASGRSAGGGRHRHRDAALQLQEERQQHHRSPSPFLTTLNLHFSNNSQQHAFPSSVPPPAESWSPSFPIIESSSSSPTPPWADDEDDILTWDWDSSIYDLDGHLQLGDNVQLSGNSFSWKPDGSATSNLDIGIEVQWRV